MVGRGGRLVVRSPDGSADGRRRPGVLVLNPQSITRRVPVALPDEATPPTPEGPVRASQFTAEGVEAVVTVAGLRLCLDAVGIGRVAARRRGRRRRSRPGAGSSGTR